MEDRVRTIHIDEVGFMISPKIKIFQKYFYLDIKDFVILKKKRNFEKKKLYLVFQKVNVCPKLSRMLS